MYVEKTSLQMVSIGTTRIVVGKELIWIKYMMLSKTIGVQKGLWKHMEQVCILPI
jgi:hypothetical protein